VLKSIAETRKLFTVESVAKGKVNVVLSKELLSLPENKQREALNGCLEGLRKDLSACGSNVRPKPDSQEEEVNKAQLRLLIEVIEGLLAQI
jgi:hypothetical protein